MRLFGLGRVAVAGCVAVVVLAVMASGASASSIYLCIGEKAGQGSGRQIGRDDRAGNLSGRD
jgi:hypothetical protein